MGWGGVRGLQLQGQFLLGEEDKACGLLGGFWDLGLVFCFQHIVFCYVLALDKSSFCFVLNKFDNVFQKYVNS